MEGRNRRREGQRVGRRIGMLGGTFDPIHYAHLRVAEEAVDQLGLDRLLMVLSAAPPHKDSREVSPFEVRWEMLQAACHGNPRLEPCDMERERTGPSFTVDTLAEIRKQVGQGAEIHLIMGMDCAVELTTWKSHEAILEAAHVAVLGRPGEERERVPDSIRSRLTFLEWEEMGVSSTAIRKLAGAGRSIRYLLPPQVEEIVAREGLYGSGERVRADGEIEETPGEVFA